MTRHRWAKISSILVLFYGLFLLFQAIWPGWAIVQGGAGLDISGLTVQTDCGVQSDERVFATGTTDPDKSPPHCLGGMEMGGGHQPGGGSLGCFCQPKTGPLVYRKEGHWSQLA